MIECRVRVNEYEMALESTRILASTRVRGRGKELERG